MLFHGLTNCPEQFDALAQHLHAGGDTVYVPRLPLHGYADRMTRAIGALTTAQIQAAATDAAHLAAQLGERVAVMGISLGGTMALWLAQTTAIDNAVGLAPFLMLPVVPRGPGMLLMRLLDWLPDFFIWWDPRKKKAIGPPYAYPGFWTHCLAQAMFAGAAIFEATATAAPRAARATIVINTHDPAVNNGVARSLAERWNEHDPAYTSQLWSDLGAVHDVIDPTTFPNATTLTYPRLTSLLDSVPKSQ